MTSGLVNASFSLPEGQAVKMIFFAPCLFICKFYNTKSKNWQASDKEPATEIKLQLFFHTSKVYLNPLVVACYSMAYNLFSNLIQHQDRT